MTSNELVPGDPRLGWLIDGDRNTSPIAVMLRDTGEAIELTIPLKGMFSSRDPYGRWWSTSVHFDDDPDQTKHSYQPPRVLQIKDAHGTVVLVGCRASGATSNFRAGNGKIVANFAVLGANHLRYHKIDGLRTEVPALAAWTRLSSMTVRTETDRNSRVQSVEMRLINADPIPLARPLNLEMRSTWRTQSPAGSFLAYEGVELVTSVKQARSWDDHFQVHSAVLDLVSIAAWKPFGISSVKVRRADDPHQNVPGASISDRWLPVATHRVPGHEPWKKEPRFLYPYDELGPGGMARWFRLRKAYGRVIGPILNILRSDNRWGHASLVQSGIALEALGYLVDVQKNGGANLNKRNQMNFKPGLHVIVKDMNFNPIIDIDDWIERADASYMGAKHPDRPEPDSMVQISTLRDNLLVLRCWIGLELGIKPATLARTLVTDPLAQNFTVHA